MSDAELARYTVRTPLALWITHGVLTALTVLLLAAVLIYDRAPRFVVFLLLGMIAASVAFWTSMSAYRVGGTRNLIRIHADRLEVPSVTKRAPLVFERPGLKLVIRDITVNYRFGVQDGRAGLARQARRAVRWRTRSESCRRSRSRTPPTRMRWSPTYGVSAGEPAIGRAAHDAPPPRTDYDDILDRELAQVE